MPTTKAVRPPMTQSQIQTSGTPDELGHDQRHVYATETTRRGGVRDDVTRRRRVCVGRQTTWVTSDQLLEGLLCGRPPQTPRSGRCTTQRGCVARMTLGQRFSSGHFTSWRPAVLCACWGRRCSTDGFQLFLRQVRRRFLQALHERLDQWVVVLLVLHVRSDFSRRLPAPPPTRSCRGRSRRQLNVTGAGSTPPGMPSRVLGLS